MDCVAKIGQLRGICQGLGLDIDDQALSNLDLFCQSLLAYNRHTNLVSRNDLEWLVDEHVLDSLTVAARIEAIRSGNTDANRWRDGISLIDVGSGGGFPGAIIAIVLPTVKVTCVDSVGKKTRFLSEAATQLAINDRLLAVTGRAEELGHDRAYRARFGFATCRAVAALPVVVELAVPFLKEGGIFLAQKSSHQFDRELEAARVIMSETGSRLRDILALNPDQAGGRARLIAAIEKQKATPERYPRPWKIISKSAEKKSSRNR